MRKNKLLLLLVLLLTVAAGAWADESSESFTTTSRATSYTGEHFKISLDKGGDDDGFILKESAYATIEALNGEIITKVEFTCGLNSIADLRSAVGTITLDGVVAATVSGVNATSLAVNAVDELQIKAVKVYYTTESTPAATGYNITLDEGTGNKDSQNWEITPKSSELSGGEDVTVKYNGSREVKSVTVVKKGGAVENPYLEWDPDKKQLVAKPMPESFTTVKSDNTEWSAGTYVVEGEVDINGTIVLTGDVNLIIKDGAKLDVYHLYGNSHNLSIYGQAQMTGELDVHYSGGDAINEIPTLEVHSAKVTATSSSDYGAGFYEIGTFNVYGGLVDAKGTAAEGGTGIVLKENGSLNIYGGEVKAEGKGVNPDNYGITSNASIALDAAYVRVYGGKLWAGCANNQALNNDGIILRKDNGYSGKIETSNDGSFWDEYNEVDGTLDTKYVRVGY